MKRNMRLVFSAGSAVLLLLAGCGGASGSSDQSKTEAKPGAAPAGGSAAANAAAPKNGPAPTQATSEGTLKMFIAAMQAGDFDRVAELTDPGSEEYANMQKLAEAFNPATANPNITKDQLDMIRGLLTKHWVGVEHTMVVEQGPRARYTLQYYSIDSKTQEKVKGGTKSVDLNQFEGKWRVLVNSALMAPGAPAATPPAPAPAPPGASAPAGTPPPAEQPKPEGQPPGGEQPKPQP